MDGLGGTTPHLRVWRCGRFELPLDRTHVMGILNITPDSFSDGGAHEDPRLAASHAIQMAEEGASIIDVGGESTRPGSDEVSPQEELARVQPAVARLCASLDIPLSIDTRHPEVAEAALQAGAVILNDVTGFRDPAMIDVARASDAGCVIMHMLGEPKTMQDSPEYEDVVSEVFDYLLERAGTLEQAGVSRERICLDPGIGFGKTTEQNIALIGEIGELVDHGYPVLVGASRKRMIGEVTGVAEPRDRLGGSLAIAAWVAQQGVSVVRAHDVAPTVQAIAMARAISVHDSDDELMVGE